MIVTRPAATGGAGSSPTRPSDNLDRGGRMGRNSGQRRAAKRRREQQRRRRADRTAGPAGDRGGDSLPGPCGCARCRDERDDSDDRDDPADPGSVEDFLLECLADVWAKGWQPVELHRQVGRSSGVGSDAVELMRIVILADAARWQPDQLSPVWSAQVEHLHRRGGTVDVEAGWLARWRSSASGDRSPQVCLDLVQRLVRLPPLALLTPPPGRHECDLPGRTALPSEQTAGLERIRALLAKAESTEFPAEADAFTAKAQALMNRLRLDGATAEALIGEAGDGASTASAIRIPVDDPYAGQKMGLLGAVARANDACVVEHPGLGLATVVGPGSVLRHVDLLFTSLLVQVQAAMARAASETEAGAHERSRRFRGSFVAAFAVRIDQRLQRERDRVFSRAPVDALPVLARDAADVDALVDSLFGDLQSVRSRRPTDAAGWLAGTSAADAASLHGDELSGDDGTPRAVGW